MSGNMLGPILGGGTAVAGGAATLLGQPEIGLPLLMGGVKTATEQQQPQSQGSQSPTDAASSLLDEAGMAASVGDPTAGAEQYLAQAAEPQSQSSVTQDVNAAAKDLAPAAPAIGKMVQGKQPPPAAPQPRVAAMPQQPPRMPQSTGKAGASTPQPPNPMAILGEYHQFLNSMGPPPPASQQVQQMINQTPANENQELMPEPSPVM